MNKPLFGLLLTVFLSLVYTGTSYAKTENDKTSKSSKSAVVGKIEQVDNESIVVEEKKANRPVKTVLDMNTPVIGKDNKKMSIKDIKKSDKVAVVTDDTTATQAGKPKKAIKVYVKSASESAQLKRRAVQGVITGISGGAITLSHQVQRDRVYSVSTTATTVIKMKDAPAATVSSLTVGMRIIAMGDLVSSGGIIASRIHVIPGRATGLQKFNNPQDATRSSESATPSASITPSPTASGSAAPWTPSPSPSPTPSSTATTSAAYR